MKPHAMLLCDFYKIAHREMYPEGTEKVYSTWTPRATRIEGIMGVVVAGNQAFVKEWLIDYFNENFFNKREEVVLDEYKRIISATLGVKDPHVHHILQLHRLGYLPLLIKAVPEGTIVPLRTPVLTIENTHPDFFWLTNYIETLASSELWPVYTAATIANEYRKILGSYADKTVGNSNFVPFQGHDFSMRGMMGVHAAIKTGLGHLLSFVGTDTIPAIQAAEHYYGADVTKEVVGTSIPATEHSIQCAYGDDEAYLRRMISEVHPSGFVSVVSDGYDFWNVINKVLPYLRGLILSRDGRVVIRPDSGDPVKIICGDPEAATEHERKGAIEVLWDIFGGTMTETNYKLLDSHIGLIYGDAITLDRAKEICKQLEAKGFASINVVFGIGSFTYQYNTRDTFGFALKSTACIIKGVEKQIFKDPKTDDGIKKSQKGKVIVTESESGQIKHTDGWSLNDFHRRDLLRVIFKDGEAHNVEGFSLLRKRLSAYRC